MQKLYLYIFGSISFLAVLFQGCVSLPTDVIMPQWDADLNVPITTKIYNLNDIIKSPDYISINSKDNTYMITSDSLDQYVPVSQFIQINTERSTPTAPVLADSKTTLGGFIEFPDGAKVNQAVISQGKFKIVAHNSSPTDVQLTINIPGITKNGTAFPITMKVPANTNSITQNFDFINCLYLQPADQVSSEDGQLGFKASASSETGLALISFETFTSNFIFSSMTGYIPTKSLGTHSSSFALNLGDATNYRDKVVLKTGSLSLTGKYHSLAPNPFIVGVNNLHLVGKRNNSQLTDTLRF